MVSRSALILGAALACAVPLAAAGCGNGDRATAPAGSTTPPPVVAISPWLAPQVQRLATMATHTPGGYITGYHEPHYGYMPSEAAGLTYFPDGSGLANWYDEQAVKTQPIRSSFARLSADGTVGAVTTVPWGVAAGPEIDGQGNGLVLGSKYADPNWSASGLTWSSVSPDGLVGKPHVLSKGHSVWNAALAVGPQGDAIAAWLEAAGTNHTSDGVDSPISRLRVAFRPAGRGSFGPAKTLARGVAWGEDTLSAAVGENGRGIVVLGDELASEHGGRSARQLVAWTGTVASGLSGPKVRTRNGLPPNHLDVALTDRGRAVVVWSTQAGGEEASTPLLVRAASLAPGGARFSPTQMLDRGDVKVAYGDGSVHLASGPNGSTTVLWGGLHDLNEENAGYTVDTATSDASGRFGARQRLSRNGGPQSIAIRPDGAAVVTWSDTDEAGNASGGGNLAAVRAAGATRFGPAEPLAFQDTVNPGNVAFNPRTGTPATAAILVPKGQTTPQLWIQARAAP